MSAAGMTGWGKAGNWIRAVPFIKFEILDGPGNYF